MLRLLYHYRFSLLHLHPHHQGHLGISYLRCRTYIIVLLLENHIPCLVQRDELLFEQYVHHSIERISSLRIVGKLSKGLSLQPIDDHEPTAHSPPYVKSYPQAPPAPLPKYQARNLYLFLQMETVEQIRNVLERQIASVNHSVYFCNALTCKDPSFFEGKIPTTYGTKTEHLYQQHIVHSQMEPVHHHSTSTVHLIPNRDTVICSTNLPRHLLQRIELASTARFHGAVQKELHRLLLLQLLLPLLCSVVRELLLLLFWFLHQQLLQQHFWRYSTRIVYHP
mmetsp:Transcript_12042/g.13193  ORF Transcript_12042/g.13193 Transcript_12042/m.13193 type:complete len:280 (-) Transcript_12042:1401-2240(-)